MQIVKKVELFQHCLPVFHTNNENPPSPTLCLGGQHLPLEKGGWDDFKEKAF